MTTELNQQYNKIIITGSTGWLGKRLAMTCTALNIPVRCLVQAQDDIQDLKKLDVEIVVGDIRQPDTLHPLFKDAAGSLLIHCAGVIHPKLRVKEFYDVNVNGVSALLALAKTHGVKRFVAMSSNSPLGNNPHSEHIFTEEDSYNPYMGYGRSKYEMECILKKHMGQGIDVTIIRAPWFYGPCQPARQTVFFSMVKNGKFPLLGQGSNKRSMAYIDNLVDGILLASSSDNGANDIFWIADENPYSMLDIITTVKEVLDDDFHIKTSRKQLQLPTWIGSIAECIDFSIQKSGFYNQKIHVLSEMNKTIACNISKAQKRLNYHPKVALREGMRRSIAWCLENGVVF